MDRTDLKRQVHDLDVTVWVGKHGIGAVTDELTEQLRTRDLIKVKFLRAARAEAGIDALAAELADRVDADVLETRGNTAVFY